jgi:hypothetical protein
VPSPSLAGVCMLVLAATAAGGCSEGAGPSEPPESPFLTELDFIWDGGLVLIATVRDESGDLVSGGAVNFQYCSKGPPRDDITNPDETSAADCANGTAAWVNLNRVTVDASGQAFMYFGAVTVVDVIGFRYTYDGEGSGAASATTVGEDWVRP